ncbi:MAG: TlpA disulfide reductase family protein [Planctomycetaceae bacterium]
MSLWLLGKRRDGRRAVYSVGGVFASALLLVISALLLSIWSLRNDAGSAAPAKAVDAAEAPAASERPRSSARPPREIILREESWEQVEKMVAAHKGKVVVVDVWMSTCGPCLERLPHFLELPERFDEEVVCISVNCDYGGIEGKPVAVYRPDALRELKKLDAARPGVEHVLLTDPLLDFMEERGIEATPTLLIHDRAGQLAKKFDNSQAFAPEEEFTAEQVDAEIRRLIGQRP